MKHFNVWSLGLLLLLYLPLQAQTEKLYTVQVGTFVDAKATDFSAIRPLGMVYAQRLDNNLFRVFIGGYSSRERAQGMIAKLRSQGFNSASVVEIPLDPQRSALIIQFATFDAKKRIDWAPYLEFQPVFAIIEEKVVKLATGPYPDVEAARQELDRVKEAGFQDAFIKRVNTAQLQKVSTFETGIKQPLIPLNLTATPPPAQPKQPAAPAQPAPSQTEPAPPPEAKPVGGATAKGAANGPPVIRSDSKRQSVAELQRALQKENTYQSAIDGLYGQGTAQAYQQALRQNRDLQKYRILAQNVKLPANPSGNNDLQTAIDQLGLNPGAAAQLGQFDHPLSMAYRAYQLLKRAGPSNDVNALMNAANRQAFAAKVPAGEAPFNYSATYAYHDLDQLLLHLMYIHLASASAYTIPCWLFQQYPVQARQAAITARSQAGRPLPLQNCDPFLQWEEARLTAAIAYDLNGDEHIEVEPLARAARERAALYLTSTPLDAQAAAEVNTWNQQVWKGLSSWAASDPMHDRLVTAFQISYFQTLVRLEDFFMDKGFEGRQAESLALATIQSMVAPHLERFR